MGGVKREAVWGSGGFLLELRLTWRKSLCCTCFCFLDVRLEEQGVPAGTAAAEQEAEGLPQAGPSPLGVLKEAGGERVVACETGEVCQVPKDGAVRACLVWEGSS